MMKFIPSLFGPKPPLQPKGPAPFAQPDERDRQALFWWLKRNTSYTAIAHNAQLWTEFVREWEEWLRSQDAPYEHLIETLKYALDSQIYYERGLKRLLLGDHSVFDRNSSEGWLAKVYTGLVKRRMEWEAPIEWYAEHEGVPLSLLRAYSKADGAAMEIASHGPGGYNGDGFVCIQRYLDVLPKPHDLPEPRWDVYFAPGKRAPKNGIYERVDANGHIVGGMAYFFRGAESEKEDWLEFGPDAVQKDTSAYFWRLIWEDARYKDGNVPDEERHYPTPSESLAIAERAQETTALGASRCVAGESCSREGFWFTPAKADSRQRFEQGMVMPDVGGDYGSTIWQWDERQDA